MPDDMGITAGVHRYLGKPVTEGAGNPGYVRGGSPTGAGLRRVIYPVVQDGKVGLAILGDVGVAAGSERYLGIFIRVGNSIPGYIHRF